jgi:vacuolar-type H+-ATPase subunit D/Vma8
MMQTNMSTRDSPLTYARLSDECKKLDEIARRMKEYSRDAPSFDTFDPTFQRLASEYREQWQNVNSLSLF